MNEQSELKKITHCPLTIIFSLVILGIFVVSFFIPDKEKSEWENRYLAKKPDVTFAGIADGSFMSSYEEYINDQMPLRDGLIKLKGICESLLLKIENNGIVKGKDSYLFTKNMGDTSTFDKNIGIIDTFVDSIDNNCIIAVAPNSYGILENNVPIGFPIVNQSEKLDSFYSDKSLLKGATVVDLKSALNAHGDEYIYYRTDHHWTTLGAYYAYREISSNPVNLDGLNVSYSDGFLGTLYAKYKGVFVKEDTITYYDIPVLNYVTDDIKRDGLYDFDKLSVFDKYGMFMWGNYGRCDIKTLSSNGKSAVIFKDSYANSLIPFLTYDYENIIVVDLRYYKGSVKELMEENEAADVLMIYNFDFMNEDNHFYKLMK